MPKYFLAGIGGEFHPAMAEVEQDTLAVSAAVVEDPWTVRYAWTDNPSAALFNGAGLPAGPFHLQA